MCRRQGDLENRISQLELTINTLLPQSMETSKTLLMQMESLRVKTGDLAERAFRQHIRETFGNSFASSFDVEDLMGLVRIAAPKQRLSVDGHVEYEDVLFVQSARCNRLAKYMFKHKLHTQFSEKITTLQSYLREGDINECYAELLEVASNLAQRLEQTLATSADSSIKREMLMHCKHLGPAMLSAHLLDPLVECRYGQVSQACVLTMFMLRINH